MILWLKKRKNLITYKHRKTLSSRWESNFTTLLVLLGYWNSMTSRVKYTDIPFLVHFICFCHVLKQGGAVAILSRILINRYYIHYNRWSTDWVKRLINNTKSQPFPNTIYYREVWDTEAKSTCHFQIPNAGKDIWLEKRPNRDWLNQRMFEISAQLITLNKDIFIMLMQLLIHLTQIVLVYFDWNFSPDLNIVNKLHTCFLDGTALWWHVTENDISDHTLQKGHPTLTHSSH